jgi:hypothetical protein
MNMMEMGSMMTGMMVFGWLGIIVVVLLVAGSIVALVRLLDPDAKVAHQGQAGILLAILAAIGILALLALTGGIAMHSSMGGMMR